MPKVAALFAGIGGFELGFARAGYEPALFCEIDPGAQAVLRDRFPGVEIRDDIRRMRFLPKDVELVTGGFPCQDISSSGSKAGIGGEKSGLVKRVFSLLKTSAAEWVVLENVQNLLTLDKGAGMETVVSGFEALGFRWSYRLLDTYGFGLPQKRRRVFFVACRSGDPRGILSPRGVDRPARAATLDRPVGFYWTEGRYGASVLQDAIPTLKSGSTVGIPSPPAILMPDGRVGTPDVRDAERLQGFPEEWTAAAEGVSRGARWKTLGNAVSVPVAAWIASRLSAAEAYDGSADRPLTPGARWPDAAWSMGAGRFAADATEWPLAPSTPPLAEFLRHELKPLSARAASGFASRVAESSVRYPEGFLDAMNAYLGRNAAEAA